MGSPEIERATEGSDTSSCISTRERLVHAALSLIWQNSYASVSVDDICQRAQVRKGSFYHFFESKSHLMAAAFDSHWAETEGILDGVFCKTQSPIQRLKSLAQSILLWQQEKLKELGHVCGCPFSSVGSELCARDEAIRLKSVEMSERWRRYIEDTVADGVAQGELLPGDVIGRAERIMALCLGTLLQARIRNDLTVLSGLESGLLSLAEPKMSKTKDDHIAKHP